MRGVGDELALALEHRLGLAAGGVERAEHALQRPRQLVDLVVGLGTGEMEAGIAGPLDLARRVGQLGDRPHRPLSRPQAREQGQDGAAEDAQDQEDADAGDRLVEVRDRARVEELSCPIGWALAPGPRPGSRPREHLCVWTGADADVAVAIGDFVPLISSLGAQKLAGVRSKIRICACSALA